MVNRIGMPLVVRDVDEPPVDRELQLFGVVSAFAGKPRSYGICADPSITTKTL